MYIIRANVVVVNVVWVNAILVNVVRVNVVCVTVGLSVYPLIIIDRIHKRNVKSLM